jgi:membrane-associated PAP2 superfamily phosphatase
MVRGESRRGWEVASIILGAVGMFVTLMMEVYTSVDVRLQDLLYDPVKKEWLVNANAPVPRFFFYDFPKVILFGFGLLLLLRLFNVPPLVRRLPFSKREATYILVCLAGIPLLVGLGKNITRVHCPSELSRYGGTEEYRRVISSEEKSYTKVPPHCFPAGHASGGFALFAFYFLLRKWQWLLLPMAYGWTMGIYQMLKGAHFLSHTLFTLFFALFFTSLAALWFFPKPPQGRPE